MSTKKLTKKDMFLALLAIEEVSENEDLVAFINHEIDLLARKSTAERKPTEKQVENEKLKSLIVEYLSSVGEPRCIKEIQADIPELAELTNQRITHLLIPLYDKGNGIISKEYRKKIPYYGIANPTTINE